VGRRSSNIPAGDLVDLDQGQVASGKLVLLGPSRNLLLYKDCQEELTWEHSKIAIAAGWIKFAA
jgi:hypothetical protein